MNQFKPCTEHDNGERSIYTLRDRDGNAQTIVVCMKHGEKMPLINEDTVTAAPAESGIGCDFTGQHDPL